MEFDFYLRKGILKNINIKFLVVVNNIYKLVSKTSHSIVGGTRTTCH